MHGFKEAVLCAACDQDNPAAAELLALFAKNDGTSPGTMQAFGELAAAWGRVGASPHGRRGRTRLRAQVATRRALTLVKAPADGCQGLRRTSQRRREALPIVDYVDRDARCENPRTCAVPRSMSSPTTARTSAGIRTPSAAPCYLICFTMYRLRSKPFRLSGIALLSVGSAYGARPASVSADGQSRFAC
ncbi:DUF6300 family protein [Streptomyces sp. NPDC056975]|uniref:DUF6300 family protein n=1 Tax=Streptomyces sp. NPDC056975 TaxID=3345985 RepID=UPI00363CF7B1